MDSNALIGTLVLLVTLGLICVLVGYSIRTINRIADKRLKSVREIARELG